MSTQAFITLDESTTGFRASKDANIKIPGYAGSLNALSVI
jgi:hypothetical protein